MTAARWAAIPVSYQFDPRVLSLSVEAEVFCTRAWLYAADHGTDGAVPLSALPLLAMKLTAEPHGLVEELIANGIAKRKKDAVVLVDFLSVNPTAKQVEAKVQKAKKAAFARWSGTKPAPDGDESAADGESEPSPGGDGDTGTSGAPSNADAVPGAVPGAYAPTDLPTDLPNQPTGVNDGECPSSFEREKEDALASELQGQVAELAASYRVADFR